MRYPITQGGSQEEFDKDWYIATKFGEGESYGFHDGVDLNLKTGGDTDLGQELKSIAKGKVVYYHYSSHPTVNFGRHLVVKIDGPWGTRWVHYAHCLDKDFTASVKDVNEGDVIARLGKSGTTAAHCHFAIYKVDPATVGGIDNVANTLTELNAYWEDPIAFIKQWMQPVTQPPVSDQSKYDFGPDFGVMELQAARSVVQDQKNRLNDFKTRLNQIHSTSAI